MSLPAGDFQYIKELLEGSTRNVLEQHRDYAVETRLQPLLQANGYASTQQLIGELRKNANPVLKRSVIETLLNHETMFFRDAQPFDVLREQILPEVLQRQADERTLTIWSAACSSGQEPYSIAMLLRTHFPQLANWQVRIVASDISKPILERAAGGRYRQIEVNRGLPAALLVRFFERQGLTWEIKPEIRQMVTFMEVNLAHKLPKMPRFDIIFLRNALLYFDVHTKRTTLSQIETVLKPGGHLFLGTAETTISISDKFTRRFEKTACYQLRQG